MGCGRLFEGDATQMHANLQRLAALPPETMVYCGHEYTLSNGRFALTVEPDNQALTVIAWLGIFAWFLVERWNAIYWLALNETDHNIIFVQAQAWLAGQGWYDLRPSRVHPPLGQTVPCS